MEVWARDLVLRQYDLIYASKRNSCKDEWAGIRSNATDLDWSKTSWVAKGFAPSSARALFKPQPHRKPRPLLHGAGRTAAHLHFQTLSAEPTDEAMLRTLLGAAGLLRARTLDAPAWSFVLPLRAEKRALPFTNPILQTHPCPSFRTRGRQEITQHLCCYLRSFHTGS